MKTALITGASGSIGYAILKKLISEGWHIIAQRLNEQNDLKLENTEWIYSDLSTEKGINFFTQNIEFVFKDKNIDLFIHCAGLQIKGEKLSVIECLKMSMINLIAPYRICETIVSFMNNTGNIILISSICADKATKDAEFYGASKAGLNSLVKSLAYKYGQLGIRLNGIEPNIIKSKQTEEVFKSQDFYSKIANQNPFNRLGTVHDIADLSMLLIKDEARWVTGQIIIADGGSFLGYGEQLWQK